MKKMFIILFSLVNFVTVNLVAENELFLPIIKPDQNVEVINSSNFESDSCGWLMHSKYSNIDPKRGKGALRLIRKEKVESRHALNIPFVYGEGTYVAFWYYADGPLSFSLRCVPEGISGFAVYAASYRRHVAPLAQKKWTKVVVPLKSFVWEKGGKFDKTDSPSKEMKPGQKFGKFMIHVLYGSWHEKIPYGPKEKKQFAVLDDFIIYNVGEQAQLKTLKLKLKQSSSLLAKFSTKIKNSFKNRKNDLSGKVDEYILKFSGYQLSNSVKELIQAVDIFEMRVKRISEHYNKAKKLTGLKSPAFAVGSLNSMERVTHKNQTYRFNGELVDSLTIDLAQGEYEGAQIVILPFLKDLKDFNILWTDFKGLKNKKILPKSILKCRIPENVFMPIRQYPFSYERLGMVPDILKPFKMLDITKEKEKAFLLTAKAPLGIKADQYISTLTLQAKNSKPVIIKLILQIRNFSIPTRGKLRNPTNFNVKELKNFYNKPVSVEQRRNWERFCLEYRVQPTAIYLQKLSPPSEDISYLLEYGLNTVISGGWMYTANLPEEKIKKQFQDIKKHGVLDMSVIYLADEAKASNIIKKANFVHKIFPGIRTMTGGVAMNDELIGHFDIWDIKCDRNENGFFPGCEKKVKSAQEKGEEVMWYICNGPTPPWANVQLGNPLFESRIWFWLTWAYGFTGSEYWNFIDFKHNNKSVGQKRWPEVPWNSGAYTVAADGNLAYPGPDGNPIASFRLENMRDGAEDWECFAILADLIELAKTNKSIMKKSVSIVKKAEKLMDFSNIIRKPYEFERNPKEYFDRRINTLNIIEELMTLVGEEKYRHFSAKKDLKLLKLRREAIAKKIIKAGGTPPEYNNSVLEKDIKKRLK